MNLLSKLKTGAFGMLVLAFFIFFSFTPQKANARLGVSISFQTFYDNLSPYGTWFNDPQYGYVWAPRVDRGFRPYYSNGYWVNTDYGNMWMSDYPWGWAAFHYGRWAFSEMYGWIWVPGDEWGPAWVTWRQGGGYYGWAPMQPGISINISFGSGYNVPNPYWTFIPYGHLYGQNFHRYYAPRRTTTIIRNTTIIHNTYINNHNTYVTGPRRSEVERATGRSVKTYQVGNSESEGRGRIMKNSIAIYRPSVSSRHMGDNATPRPRQVKTIDRQGVFGKNSVAPSRAAIQSQQNQLRQQDNSRFEAQPNRSVQTIRNNNQPRNIERGSMNQKASPYQQPIRSSNAGQYRSNESVSRNVPSRAISNNSGHRSSFSNAAATENRRSTSSNKSGSVQRSNAPKGNAAANRSAESPSRTSNQHSESRSFRR